VYAAGRAKPKGNVLANSAVPTGNEMHGLKAVRAVLIISFAFLFLAQSYPTQTTAPLDYFVSQSLGDDAKSCTSAQEPCLTIQGALDKIPKRLRHVVTVTVAEGYYKGFVIEGFEVHPSWTPNGAGLIIQGAAQPVSPATGTVAGIASACVGGGQPDPNTHATLTDSNQMWTPNDKKLRGRKLCLTSGGGKDECLAIEDNTEKVITLAGYWDDFHAGWKNCTAGDAYEITEPATHLKEAVLVPQGVGGVANGQGNRDPSHQTWAAIIVSNVHGGASATAGNDQPADNFQVLLKDFDVLADDWNGGHVVHSVAYVDSSDHVGFKHFTAGTNTLSPNQEHRALYQGSALFTFRNSTAWTVQSSYANGDAPTSPSSPMISCSRSATADTVVGVFGNVVDNMPAYFGDEYEDQTSCHSSVIFGGESIRNSGGDPHATSQAAITIQSGALVHFVGTKINGSRVDLLNLPACTQDSDCSKPWDNPLNPDAKCNQNEKRCTLPFVFTADCVRLGDARGAGFGRAYFEGGDFSNCNGTGIKIAGNWAATFVNVPTTSAASPNFVQSPGLKVGLYNGTDGANNRFGIEAANGARVFGLDRAAQIRKGGDAVLKGTFVFNLDAGEQGTTGDIWWEQQTDTLRRMTPQGGAKIVNLGLVDFDSITPNSLQNLPYANVPIDGSNNNGNKLVAGDVFAVVTNGGNHAKVKVVTYGYDLTIRWMTYSAPNPVRGKFDPLNLTFDNAPTGFSYDQVWYASGQTITEPQRGGLFSLGFGEAVSGTSTVPPNWISFGQGVVYGFTSQSGKCYAAREHDHVIGMVSDDSRNVTILPNRPAGTHYVVIDTSGSINPANTITVSVTDDKDNSCTQPRVGLINGAQTAMITPGTNRALEIISDGKNYWIISLK
jgi:hypothetical protein